MTSLHNILHLYMWLNKVMLLILHCAHTHPSPQIALVIQSQEARQYVVGAENLRNRTFTGQTLARHGSSAGLQPHSNGYSPVLGLQTF